MKTPRLCSSETFLHSSVNLRTISRGLEDCLIDSPASAKDINMRLLIFTRVSPRKRRSILFVIKYCVRFISRWDKYRFVITNCSAIGFIFSSSCEIWLWKSVNSSFSTRSDNLVSLVLSDLTPLLSLAISLYSCASGSSSTLPSPSGLCLLPSIDTKF